MNLVVVFPKHAKELLHSARGMIKVPTMSVLRVFKAFHPVLKDNGR